MSTSSTAMAPTRAVLSLCVIVIVTLVNANENHNHHACPHHGHSPNCPTPHAHHHHGRTRSGGSATREWRTSDPWKDAQATFYGGPEGTLGGACGYEDKDKEIYGKDTTALSTALFKDGFSCGACFEIKCDQAKQPLCKPGGSIVTVTATDLCPPGGSGWCDSPKHHFDLSQPAFLKIAEYKAGVVPVKYRRVQCKRRGGIRYKVTGNPYFEMVGITNVGGAGDVKKLEVKVGGEWRTLHHNYGDKWDTNSKLVGEKLTFRVTTSDGKSVITDLAAPENWQFGQTYQAKQMA